MKIINPLQAIALAATLGIPSTALAQKVKAPAGGKQISNELIGIFFEDISYSADGGLYSELIQNGSFEYNPTERDGWGPGTEWRFLRPGHSLGQMMPQMADPIHPNNPTYMRLTVERVGHYYDYDGWTGVGMRNDGFDGIAVKGGAKYDFSVFLRNGDDKKKDVRIVLVGDQNVVLGEATITAEGKAWKKYTAELTASADYDRANLQILCLGAGEGKWRVRQSVVVEPNSKVFVEDFDHTALVGMERLCVQVMAWKEGKAFDLKPAMSVDVRLDCTKFYKLHAFRPNEFFRDPNWTVALVRDDKPVRPMSAED